jgi:RNA polymerase subunit RPABC4/transcription elongation factor Spt4
MPTFKHPCPYCDKFIDRAVAACPYCGQVDPFAPKRCQTCRRIVEDPAWTVCPGCGNSLLPPPPPAVAAPDGAATAPAAATPAASATAAQASSPSSAQPASPTPPAPRPPLNPDAAAPVLSSAGACGGCGAPLPAGARFCTICGTVAG